MGPLWYCAHVVFIMKNNTASPSPAAAETATDCACPSSPTVVEPGTTAKRPTHEQVVKKEKELRENLTEKEIDDMVEDSFPASDPPSTY